MFSLFNYLVANRSQFLTSNLSSPYKSRLYLSNDFIVGRVNKSLNPFHATFQKVLNPSFSTIPLLLRQHKSPYLFASHCIDCHCFVTKLSLPQISLYSQNASPMIEWNQRIMGNKFQAVHPCPHLRRPKQFFIFLLYSSIS